MARKTTSKRQSPKGKGREGGVPELRKRLVLNRWAFSKLGWGLESTDKPLHMLRDKLRDVNLIGVSGGRTRFAEALLSDRSTAQEFLPELERHDRRIVSITEQLYPPAKGAFEWTWFQWLSLLFAEMYLDRYFRDREAFCAELNRFGQSFWLKFKDEIPEFELESMNKLAFQNATGSGKTHLMHANILQYLHHAGERGKPRNIVLITPSEGLAKQHVEKFPSTAFYSRLVRENEQTFFGDSSKPLVRVVDYHHFAKGEKGQRRAGKETIEPEIFGSQNLVLVDEGHRGAASKNSAGEAGQWKSIRDEMAEDGFSFEYSATFAQAIGTANKFLSDEYAKAMLFDYSYGEFYRDGYGKEYRILNIEGRKDEEKPKRGKATAKKDDPGEPAEHSYLVGAMLAFYQQIRYYEEQRLALAKFNIEKPLLVLVGASVSGKVAEAVQLSDVQEILRFLQRMLKDKSGTTDVIRKYLLDEPQVVDGSGLDVYSGTFEWLRLRLGLEHKKPEEYAKAAAAVFADMKRRVFGSNEETVTLTHVSATGEIELRVGSADEPFGVINVGESGAADIMKRCKEMGVEDAPPVKVGGREWFSTINNADSPINVLIGSRKFTEGWDSWRVSSMGLLNLGKSEGAQVIQMFGRGIRLKGEKLKDSNGTEKGYSLKRSRGAEGEQPEHWVVETLNVFGVRANYMTTFRDALKLEDLDTDTRRTWRLPVVELFRDKKVYEKLKIPVVPGGDKGFRRENRFGVQETFGELRNDVRPVRLNWFPVADGIVSKGAGASETVVAPKGVSVPTAVLEFIDWDQVYLRVHRRKPEVGYNLRLSAQELRKLMELGGEENGWYELLLPNPEFRFDRLGMWQDVVVELLMGLLRRVYGARKAKHDSARRVYVTLAEALKSDDLKHLIPEHIQLTAEAKYLKHPENKTIKLIDALSKEFTKDTWKKLQWPLDLVGMAGLERHLYQPLVIKGRKGKVTVTPTLLTDGEAKLVEDVTAECESGVLVDSEVYLLRNGSRGNGLGFSEAGNFYPDFILWLLGENGQDVVFLDPKGMGRISDESAKVNFHKGIKDIEKRLSKGGETIRLHTYILSNSQAEDEPEFMKNRNPEELAALGVYRMQADGYLKRVLKSVRGE